MSPTRPAFSVKARRWPGGAVSTLHAFRYAQGDLHGQKGYHVLDHVEVEAAALGDVVRRCTT